MVPRTRSNSATTSRAVRASSRSSSGTVFDLGAHTADAGTHSLRAEIAERVGAHAEAPAVLDWTDLDLTAASCPASRRSTAPGRPVAVPRRQRRDRRGRPRARPHRGDTGRVGHRDHRRAQQAGVGAGRHAQLGRNGASASAEAPARSCSPRTPATTHAGRDALREAVAASGAEVRFTGVDASGISAATTYNIMSTRWSRTSCRCPEPSRPRSLGPPPTLTPQSQARCSAPMVASKPPVAPCSSTARPGSSPTARPTSAHRGTRTCARCAGHRASSPRRGNCGRTRHLRGTSARPRFTARVVQRSVGRWSPRALSPRCRRRARHRRRRRAFAPLGAVCVATGARPPPEAPGQFGDGVWRFLLAHDDVESCKG